MNDILDKKNWRKSHILTPLHHLDRLSRDLLPRSTQFRSASSSLALPSIPFFSFITRGSGVFCMLTSSLSSFFGFWLNRRTHVPFCSHYSQISITIIVSLCINCKSIFVYIWLLLSFLGSLYNILVSLPSIYH